MALHLSLYRCTQCNGPVVAANLGAAGPVGATGSGNVPQPATLTPVGARCLRCGHVQNNPHGPVIPFPPQAWEE